METCSRTQFVLDGLQDAVGVAEHARCSCADLNEVFSHGLTQEHCVESGDLVDSHGSDFQHLGDLKEDKLNTVP